MLTGPCAECCLPAEPVCLCLQSHTELASLFLADKHPRPREADHLARGYTPGAVM